MKTPEILVNEVVRAVLGGRERQPMSISSLSLDSFSLLSIYIELQESGLVRKEEVERAFMMGQVTSTDELLVVVREAWAHLS
jgi:hypothetical protein